jgi:MFS family permease
MSSPHPRELRRPLRIFPALAVPNFRRYVAGQALSLIGTWTETVAQALLVLHLSHSGTVLGLVTAARYLPILLLSPYAGVLVDRYNKRRILLITQVGLGLVSAVLGASVLTGSITLWQVVVLALVFGAFSAVDNPARQAFVPDVVGRDLLRSAVTLNSTTVNVARVVGPTVAAVLVATIGIGWCFVVNAVSFGFVIVSLVSLDTGQLQVPTPVARGPGQLRQGLTYVRNLPGIVRVLVMMALVGTFAFEFEVTLPLLAQNTFHGSATAYSWLLGGLGAGAVAGGLYWARSSATGLRRLSTVSACYALTLVLVAIAPNLTLAVAADVLVGIATIAFLTTGNATVQLAASSAYRGRVTALWSMGLIGSTPIGSPVVGLVSDLLGPRYAVGLGALACAVAVAVGRWPARATGQKTGPPAAG